MLSLMKCLISSWTKLKNSLSSLFKSKTTKVIGLVALMFISIITGYYIPKEEVVTTNTVIEYKLPEDYTLIKQQMTDMSKINKELKAAYEALKSQGAEVKVVTEIQTVIQGGETIYKVLPAEYIYKLSNGLPVAAFEASSEYKFETYDLQMIIDLVILKDSSTAVKLTAKSSGSEEEFQMPVTKLNTFVIPEKPKPLFRPGFMLTAGVSYPYTGPEIGLAVPIFTGAKDKLAFVAPMVSISEVPKIGIAPILFNVGKPLPLIDDFWIAPAYQTNTVEHYGTVLIGTKL